MFMVLTPLNPVTPGHKIVIFRNHTEDFTDNSKVCGMVFRRASQYVQDNMQGQDVNLITSKGSAATQTVPHFHVHIVPRREGDGLHLPWTPDERTPQGDG